MAGREKSGSGIVKYIILMILAALVALGIFLMLNRSRGEKQSDEDTMVLTRVQSIMTENLDLRYPENERRVVAKYGEIMQVLYGEQCTEQEMDAIAGNLMLLYDSELLLNQPNYVAQLKREIAQKHTDGFTIQNYVVPDKEKDVSFFTQEGRECAGMEVLFSVRNATRIEATYYVFILRKDDQGRWKILGWEPKEDQTIRLF